jgi:hypothetical protein
MPRRRSDETPWVAVVISRYKPQTQRRIYSTAELWVLEDLASSGTRPRVESISKALMYEKIRGDRVSSSRSKVFSRIYIWLLLDRLSYSLDVFLSGANLI